MESRNYYETLNIRVGASRREIARAYRRLARRYHPDLQPPERKLWAEERMKLLNEAYAALNGPHREISNDIAYWQRRAAEHRRRRQRSPRLHRFLAQVRAVLGVLMILLDWSALFRDWLTSAQIVGLRVLVATTWMGVFAVLFFRIVPFRR
jgi:curved DNA-binding protein CbpA